MQQMLWLLLFVTFGVVAETPDWHKLLPQSNHDLRN
jgi:hypothetical protein